MKTCETDSVDRKRSQSDLTSKFNENNNANESSKTIWPSLKCYGYRRCVCKKKIRIQVAKRVKRVRWRASKITWTIVKCKKINFCAKSQIVIVNDCRVYIWKRSVKYWLPYCIYRRTSKKISVMIWGCITYQCIGTLCRVNVNKNPTIYIDILDNNLWYVVARHFPDNNYIYL